jgi:hypothetical protein
MPIQFRSSLFAAMAVLILALPGVAGQKIADTGSKYDVAHQVKIQGTVEEVREVPGDYEGTHLLVKTDQGLVLVQVAPAAFLKEMDTSYKKGDVVQVVGAKALDATEEQVLAREITIGADSVTLRDDKGVPVWAGWKPAKASAH